MIRRNQSVPAFGNCTLDDNPGNGDLRNGLIFDTQINGYLSWDSETIVDEPNRWEMTVILDPSAPLGECRVDLTPRKCQKFKPAPGTKLKWTCTTVPPAIKTKDKSPERPPAGRVLGAAAVQADKHGLVTIRQMPILKGRQRVVIAKQ